MRIRQITIEDLRVITPCSYTGGRNRNQTPEQRFWNIVKKGGPDECWLWQGAKAGSGYGVLNIHKRNVYAHRISYMLHYGAIPEGRQVCHKCDNPACCNPDHLFTGTQYDNVHDQLAKGRRMSGDRKGERAGCVKLTNSEVLTIRELAQRGIALNEIAKLYPISKDHIYNIIRRRCWTHLP